MRRPFSTQKTDLGTIQLPEVKRASIASTVAGTTGRPILIGGVPRPTFDDKAPPKKIWILASVGAPGSAPK